MNIPDDVQKVFDDIVAEASDEADRQHIRNALQGAWDDQRRPAEKSCIIGCRETNTFYDVKMKLQTKRSKSRWVVELKVTQV